MMIGPAPMIRIDLMSVRLGILLDSLHHLAFPSVIFAAELLGPILHSFRMGFEGTLVDGCRCLKHHAVLKDSRTNVVAGVSGRVPERLEVAPIEIEHGMARLAAIVAVRRQHLADLRISIVGRSCHHPGGRWAQKKGALAARPSVKRRQEPGARALFRPESGGREGDLWTRASAKTRYFCGFEVVRQNIRQFGGRQASEPAISTQTEYRQVPARHRDPLREPRHIVDRAEVDTRRAGLEVLQRREESLVAAVEHRDVHPIHPPAGGGDATVCKFDRLPEVVGLEARPAAERAEAEVVAERDLVRDVRREVAHLRQVTLDRALERKARDAAVGILDFGRAVPLDGEFARGNMRDDVGDLGAQGLLVAGPDARKVTHIRKDARRQHAVDLWDRDLEAKVRRQHAPFLHNAEHEIRVDGVASEAEPPAGIAEAHALDAILHLELPGVGGVAWELPLDAVLVGRWPLNDLKLGMGGQHLIMHAADPVPPWSDLAVRHREQEFAEWRAEGAEYVLRRIERDAADQM